MQLDADPYQLVARLACSDQLSTVHRAELDALNTIDLLSLYSSCKAAATTGSRGLLRCTRSAGCCRPIRLPACIRGRRASSGCGWGFRRGRESWGEAMADGGGAPAEGGRWLAR